MIWDIAQEGEQRRREKLVGGEISDRLGGGDDFDQRKTDGTNPGMIKARRNGNRSLSTDITAGFLSLNDHRIHQDDGLQAVAQT